VMRWGLVPFWAKDIKVGFANINAKAEGVETKPAFREAFRQRRCLVPVDSFYEWKKTGNAKQPYAIALADQKLMALAGLWESWRSPAGERVRSFAIVHHAAEQTLRRTAQPHAGDPRPGGLAGVAGRGTRGRGAAEIFPGPLPFRSDGLLAGQPSRRQRQKQRPLADRADRSAVSEQRCRSRRPVIH
jgi:hypothetical protein